MGFSLESMIKDLEELLAAGASNDDIAKQLAWWKQYAKDCGDLK